MNATINRFDADIKAVTDGGIGEFEAVLSVPTVDRDGEVVDARAFDPLPEYIPIDIDHGMSVTSTVGSGTPFYDGDTLRFRGSFASTQLGQEVRTLVMEGHIRKMSVAFMSAQRTEDESGTVHVVKAELLNAAIVAIPSNREADILAAKALDLRATKAASLQQIHDLATSAGADCSGSTKSVALEVEATESTVCPTCGQPPVTDPEVDAAVELAAALPLADVLLAQAAASIASAELTLLP
jgi:hypothetical protein